MVKVLAIAFRLALHCENRLEKRLASVPLLVLLLSGPRRADPCQDSARGRLWCRCAALSRFSANSHRTPRTLVPIVGEEGRQDAGAHG